MKKQNLPGTDVSCETFFKELANCFDGTGLKIDKDRGLEMYRFWKLLLKWNSVHNLTAITDTGKAIYNHFADSLLPLLIPELIKPGQKVLDFGTGGGFPGIPLSIMVPEAEFFLLDKARKKISFLEFAAAELSLNNIHPVCSDIADNNKKYDLVLSRAVRIDHAIFANIKKHVFLGGFFVCYLSGFQKPLFEEKVFLEKNFNFFDTDRKIILYRF